MFRGMFVAAGKMKGDDSLTPFSPPITLILNWVMGLAANHLIKPNYAVFSHLSNLISAISSNGNSV